jgi:sugar/nucleoside kinase (ribokinase family)
MTVQDTGRRTFFHQRGANALLGPEHFELKHSKARIFHLGYLLLLDRLDTLDDAGHTPASYLLENARTHGFLTTVDLVSEDSDRFRQIVSPSLPFIDVLFANEYEAARLTQLSPEEGNVWVLMEQAARRLLDMGVQGWVVLHCTQGALAMSREHRYYQPSVRVPKAVIKGAAGAGDAFAAGVLLGLHDETPMPEALQLGVCAAAASLTEASCSDGLKSREEVLRLGSQWGFHTIGA